MKGAFRRKTKFQKYIENWVRDRDEVIWNVVKNIDTYFIQFEEYLNRLVDFGLLSKNSLRYFISDFWERLYNEIIWWAYIDVLDINYGEEIIKVLNDVWTEIKVDLKLLDLETKIGLIWREIKIDSILLIGNV